MEGIHTTDRWKLQQREKAMREEEITFNFHRKRHSEWLRSMLKSIGVPYRIWKIRDSRIVTTDIHHCPCCQRLLQGENQ